MYRKSCCTTLCIGVGGGGSGVGISKIFKFICQSCYVMGKALTGELSCTQTGFATKTGFMTSCLLHWIT